MCNKISQPGVMLGMIPMFMTFARVVEQFKIAAAIIFVLALLTQDWRFERL